MSKLQENMDVKEKMTDTSHAKTTSICQFRKKRCMSRRKKPTRLSPATGPEDFIRQRFQKLELMNPYEDLTIKKQLENGILERLQTVWEGHREHDPAYYGYDTQFANFLTFVWFKNKKYEMARNENQKILGETPDNLMALLTKANIETQQGGKKEAEKTWTRMKNILENEEYEIEKKVYECELANMHFLLGPIFYLQAIKLFANVLHWILNRDNPQDTSGVMINPRERIYLNLGTIKKLPGVWAAADEKMKKKLVLWSFQLAMVQNKMMAKSNITTLYGHQKPGASFNINNYYEGVRDTLKFVADTEDIEFAGRAWVEMADGFKIYELLPGKNKRSLPDEKDVDAYIHQAVEVGSKNAHVLQLVGRHFRQKATSLDEFKTALKYLEKSVEQCPTMHIAHHHLALCYRSMWHIDSGLEEAKLHTNYTRQTGKTKQKKRRSKKQEQPRKNAYSKLADEYGAMSIRDPDVSTSPNSSDMKDDIAADCHRSGAQSSTPGCSITHAPECSETGANKARAKNPCPDKTVYPRYPADGKSVPKHFKEPDFYDKLRTRNSNACVTNEYLRKALDHLKKANEIVNETSSRYLIDLARLKITFGETKAANELFMKAKTLIVGPQSYNDAAYLYEQWGLLMMESGKIDDAKDQFLISLTNSAKGKQKSRMAFYMLRNILEKKSKEVTNTETSTGIVKEYAFIHKLIEDYAKARESLRKQLGADSRTICKEDMDIMEHALRDNDGNFELLWELIDVYHRESNFGTALQYMKLYLSYEQEPGEIGIALDIALKALLVQSPEDDFRQVFCWLFPSQEEVDEEDEEQENEPDEIEETAEEDDNTPAGNSEEYDEECRVECDDDIDICADVLLLVKDVTDPTAELIKETLEGLCGLKVNVATSCGNDDLYKYTMDGTVFDAFDAICENMGKIRTCVIDADNIHRKKDPSLSQGFDMYILKLMKIDENRPKTVFFTRSTTDGLQTSKTGPFPVVNISPSEKSTSEKDKVELANRLLPRFLEQPE